jgi:hypothetical protein
MIYLILVVYLLEWVLYGFVPDQWVFLLGSKILLLALLSTTLLIYTDKLSLILRSIIAWLVIDSWCNFLEFIVWQVSSESLNSTWFAAIVFVAWLLFIMERQYPEKLDLVNLDNVNILILKPRSSFDIIKGLIGLPASSICIISHGYVWCFRSKSGVFEKTDYHYQWTESHLVIDTKIKCNDEHKIILDNLLGTKRLPCIKCIYTIQCLLNMLGGKYSVKNWFDYMPGIYFMRIL